MLLQILGNAVAVHVIKTGWGTGNLKLPVKIKT
jgi:hypothetical protein